MRYRWTMYALISFLVLMAPCRVHSIEVWLRNGDRLSGALLSSDTDTTTLKSPYLGVLTLENELIVKISDNTLEKALPDEEDPSPHLVKETDDADAEVANEVVNEPVDLEPTNASCSPRELLSMLLDSHGRWNVGVNITNGNSETKAYYGDTEVVARDEKKRFTFGGKYNRLENKDNPTLDYQLAYISFDNFLNGSLYLHTNASGIWDEFKDIRLKSLVSLGLGYQFFETDNTKLSFELSGSYVNEDRILADDKEFTSSRWGLSFEHYLHEDLIELFHKHYGLISLLDADDVSIQAQTGLRFRIYDGLVATAQLNHNWDNTPSPGRIDLDEIYLVTLGHKF